MVLLQGRIQERWIGLLVTLLFGRLTYLLEHLFSFAVYQFTLFKGIMKLFLVALREFTVQFPLHPSSIVIFWDAMGQITLNVLLRWPISIRYTLLSKPGSAPVLQT